MKIINDANASKKIVISAGIGIASAFAVMFILLLLFALIMLKFDALSRASDVLATVVLMVSSLTAGVIASKKCGFKVLFTSVISGTLFYFLVAVISAAITKESFGKLFLLRMMLCIVSSVVGAFLSVKKKNKSMI